MASRKIQNNESAEHMVKVFFILFVAAAIPSTLFALSSRQNTSTQASTHIVEVTVTPEPTPDFTSSE